MFLVPFSCYVLVVANFLGVYFDLKKVLRTSLRTVLKSTEILQDGYVYNDSTSYKLRWVHYYYIAYVPGSTKINHGHLVMNEGTIHCFVASTPEDVLDKMYEVYN